MLSSLCFVGLKSFKERNEITYTAQRLTSALSFPMFPPTLLWGQRGTTSAWQQKSYPLLFPNVPFFAKIIFPRQGHSGGIEVSRNGEGRREITQKRPWQHSVKWFKVWLGTGCWHTHKKTRRVCVPNSFPKQSKQKIKIFRLWGRMLVESIKQLIFHPQSQW
jgi:hypothetical protein